MILLISPACTGTTEFHSSQPIQASRKGHIEIVTRTEIQTKVQKWMSRKNIPMK